MPHGFKSPQITQINTAQPKAATKKIETTDCADHTDFKKYIDPKNSPLERGASKGRGVLISSQENKISTHSSTEIIVNYCE